MPSFRLDPYLWVHLAGLAAVPIWLDLCLLGLAAGNPVLPVGLEVTLLVLLGTLPVVWMQWQRPFCIYSLVFLALRPAALEESQRKILRLFRGTAVRLVSLLIPVPLILALVKLYDIAPLAAGATPFPNRTAGFLAAAIAFFLANLFLQVPASVIKVLLTSEKAFAQVSAYPVDSIGREFTLIGLPVKGILPTLQPAVTQAAPSRSDTTAIGRVEPPQTPPNSAKSEESSAEFEPDPVVDQISAETTDTDIEETLNPPMAASNVTEDSIAAAEADAPAPKQGGKTETGEGAATTALGASAEEISLDELDSDWPELAAPEAGTTTSPPTEGSGQSTSDLGSDLGNEADEAVPNPEITGHETAEAEPGSEAAGSQTEPAPPEKDEF